MYEKKNVCDKNHSLENCIEHAAFSDKNRIVYCSYGPFFIVGSEF